MSISLQTTLNTIPKVIENPPFENEIVNTGLLRFIIS